MVLLDFFSDISFRSYLGLGVDSAPSENEFLRVKAAGASGGRPHHLHVPNVMKSGSLNLLEPSGPHRPCYGAPLPLPYVIVTDGTVRKDEYVYTKRTEGVFRVLSC